MIVGVALAGGQSRRMGRDKASLPLPQEIGGADMLSWTARRLEEVCDEVLIADRGRGPRTGHRSIEDGPGRGPAAGILGAAAARPGRPLLVLACDLPLVPVALLRRLARQAGGDDRTLDWVLPTSEHGRLETLCAVYAPRTLERLAARVRRGRFALHELREEPGLEIECVEPAAWRSLYGDQIFTNVNRPEDLDDIAAARQIRLRPGPTSR